jgi:hypothetical protein
MTRNEMEKEVINLAMLRWGILRIKDEYKQDFNNFVQDLKSLEEKDDCRDWINNPVFFKNFPMLPEESIDDFEFRIEEAYEHQRQQDIDLDFSRFDMTFLLEWDELYREGILRDLHNHPIFNKPTKIKNGIIYLTEGAEPESTFSLNAVEIERKWKIKPPVDPGVDHLNPWSLLSLTYRPVIYLGNVILKPPPYNIEQPYQLEEEKCKDIERIIESGRNWFGGDFSFFRGIVFKDYSSISKTSKIILEINLKENIKYIKHQIDKILTTERRKLKNKGLLGDERENQEATFRQIKTYRLRKEGKTLSEIKKGTNAKSTSAAFDDFKAGFKLVHDRDYNPAEDSKEFKEYPITLTCKDCKTKDVIRFNKCSNRVDSNYKWSPLCPEVALSLKGGQKKYSRELREADTKDRQEID